jgi:hypothetical protein
MNPQAYLSACADAIRKKAVSFGREQETVNRKQRKPSAKKRSAVSQEKAASSQSEESNWQRSVCFQPGKKFRISSFWFRGRKLLASSCQFPSDSFCVFRLHQL